MTTSTLGLDVYQDRCPAGFHTTQHPALCACPGLALKAQGQSRATSAHLGDRAKVDAAIRQLASTGRPFSANDARAIHGIKGGVVGAAFTAANKAGLIRWTGTEASTKPNTHGHPVGTWIGVAS